MNIVVFGPHMERRPLPAWALLPVEMDYLTALEVLVQRTGEEIYGKAPVTIIGAPWVNPRGRGRISASIEDYLDNHVSLYRALEVAFNAARAKYVADGAVIACDVSLQQQLVFVQQWVSTRSSAVASLKRVIWATFDPKLQGLAVQQNRQQSGEALKAVMKNHPLPSSEPTLAAFCEALGPLFK